MAALIRDYEDEFTTGCESVKRELQGLRAGFAADGTNPPPAGAITKDRGTVNRNIGNNLRRLRDVLSALEIESAQAPLELRTEVKGRLAGYKATLAALEKDAAVIKKQSADADREELLRDAKSTADKNLKAVAGEGDDETTKMKKQLARNTALMQSGSGKLRQAEALTHEMNDLADNTLEELQRQRRTIQNISHSVRATDEELSHAQRILRKMHREMLKNKAMLAAIIAILLIMIVGLLYYQFGGTSATHSEAASSVSGVDHSVPTLPPPTGDSTWMPTVPPPPTESTASANSTRL